MLSKSFSQLVAIPIPLEITIPEVRERISARENRVTCDDLADMLVFSDSKPYDAIIVIDARYDYEFSGGCIKGARHIETEECLNKLYEEFLNYNVCFIFHCEFSSHRGPSLMTKFREYDRRQNMYPEITYPHVYLLEGGYCEFYKKYPSLCDGGYVPMRDSKFIENGNLRKSHSNFENQFGFKLNKRSRNSLISKSLNSLPSSINMSCSNFTLSIDCYLDGED